MSWPDYKGKTIGFAKVMGELPISNGTLAYEIMNFTSSDTGFLENKFKILPLIPNEWNLDEKNFKDFKELPLKNKLSFSVKNYKQLELENHYQILEKDKKDKNRVPNGVKLFKLTFIYMNLFKWKKNNLAA